MLPGRVRLKQGRVYVYLIGWVTRGEDADSGASLFENSDVWLRWRLLKIVRLLEAGILNKRFAGQFACTTFAIRGLV